MKKRILIVLTMVVLTICFILMTFMAIQGIRIMKANVPVQAAQNLSRVLRKPVALVVRNYRFSSRSETRQKAVLVLAALGDTNGLCFSLRDSDWEVKKTAAASLGDYLHKTNGARKLAIQKSLAAAVKPYSDEARSREKQLQWSKAAEQWDKAALLEPLSQTYKKRTLLCRRRADHGVTIENVYVDVRSVEEMTTYWYISFEVHNNLPATVHDIHIDENAIEALKSVKRIGYFSGPSAAFSAYMTVYLIRQFANDSRVPALLKAYQKQDPNYNYDKGTNTANPFDLTGYKLKPGQSKYVSSQGIIFVSISLGANISSSNSATLTGMCLRSVLEEDPVTFKKNIVTSK